MKVHHVGVSTPILPLPSTLRLVIGLNLAAFALETASALTSGSVSLLADSIDFLEDVSISAIVLIGLRWSGRVRGRIGAALAFVILVPSAATLGMAWHRFASATAPEPVTIGIVGLVALVVNATCAVLLARHRATGGSLTRAAFLSARNDTLANVAIIAAGVATLVRPSPWPDLAAGIGIALLNAGAAWDVWEAARKERDVD